jgi:hypothetical protein
MQDFTAAMVVESYCKLSKKMAQVCLQTADNNNSPQRRYGFG